MIVRDEEQVLERALSSVDAVADEIVVVDTGSTDRTREIAAAHPGVRLLEATFHGFGDAKQRALDHCTGDYVLALDADEHLSAELVEKIRRLKANDRLREFAGFRVRRRNWIRGREMHGMGLGHQYVLRLFRRSGARYNGRLVHEGVLPGHGPIGRLEQPIEHETLRSIDGYLKKIELYSSLEIQEGTRAFRAWHMVLNPPAVFWKFYVWRGGFRDGLEGLLWAGLTAVGEFLRDLKLWVRERGSAPGS